MTIFEEIVKSYGNVKSIQARFGYTSPMAVYNWRTRGIPKDKLIDIHNDTGIDLQKLNTGELKKG